VRDLATAGGRLITALRARRRAAAGIGKGAGA
jgi:hypothetical protein